MVKSFSVMSLDTEHLQEICDDIKLQYEKDIAYCPLFNMTLVPEGNPPSDKAGIMCEKYKLFKEKLSPMGIPSGVLMQATIGHGWKLGEMFPYQSVVGMVDGKTPNVVCPYDEGFREYIYDAAKKIASVSPDHIMLDDDFRLIARSGKGCGCPLHMKRFNELAGTDYSREELLEKLSEETEEAKRLNNFFVETQREALVGAAKAIRAGIDSVNPHIQGSFCAESANAEFGAEIAKIMAGEGNPVIMRVNNGFYSRMGAKFITRSFFRAAAQIEKTKDTVDVYIAETDTCPQNRYSTPAMSLHSHYAGSIIEGVTGANHWITRMAEYEPKSGEAYRRVLAKYSGFYSALSDIVKDVEWKGFRIPVNKEAYYKICKENSVTDEEYSGWGNCVLECLGLPMYFSSKNSGILCLEGKVNLSDEDIKEALKGYVLLDSLSADELVKRGFGKYIGVSVREWTGKEKTGELICFSNNKTGCQVDARELVIEDESASIESYITNSKDRTVYENLFPGSVKFKNSLGGTVVTFSGTPLTAYFIPFAYAFLNQSRKEQFINLFGEEMPAYYPGDEEMYFRAGLLPDGKMVCTLFNLGYDPIEKTELVINREVSEIQYITPDGKFENAEFELYDGKYVINASCKTLDPLILLVK